MSMVRIKTRFEHVQSVVCDSKEHAAETQQSNKRMSWKAADLRKECTCDRTFKTRTDVLQDAQVMLESGSTQTAEQESNKKRWTKVMELNSRPLEIRKKLCKSLMLV